MKISVVTSIVLAVLLSALSLQYARKVSAFQKYKEEQVKETQKLKDATKKLESENAIITQTNAVTLATLRTSYENTINTVNSDYNNRLQQLENRTNHYRSLSETSSIGCRELADTAARLDRLVEEGRQLVIEFREQLALRTDQLKIVVNQLHADRQLLKGSNNE